MADIDFVLHGVDTSSGTYMAWESETFAPQYVVANLQHVRDAVKKLNEGLPDFGEGLDGIGGEQVAAMIAGGFADAESRSDSRPLVASGDNIQETDVDATFAGSIKRLRELGNQPIFSVVGDDFLVKVMQPVVDALQLGGFLETLRAEIEKARENGNRIVLAVNPPASCGQVPWEMIPTGGTREDGTREVLLDVVDVVTMAPILARDGNPDLPHPAWHSGNGVYLIQPWIDITKKDNEVRDRAVLACGLGRQWLNEIGARNHGRPRNDQDLVPLDGLAGRAWLSENLRKERSSICAGNRNEAITRLLYVGHMAGMGTSSSLMLKDSRDVFGMAELTSEGLRPFSAIDLTANTNAWREEYYRRSNAEAEARRQASKNTDSATDEGFDLSVGSLAAGPKWEEYKLPDKELLQWNDDGSTTLLYAEGENIWPMPPRVGLVACYSGGEASQVEPYGMVTACLEAGAELVLATRWTMLTDRAFRWTEKIREIGALPGNAGHLVEAAWAQRETMWEDWDPKGPFYELARAVDAWLQSEDPIGDMHAWKRNKLAEWRKDASNPKNSPITWTGVTAYRAPDRTVRN